MDVVNGKHAQIVYRGRTKHAPSGVLHRPTRQDTLRPLYFDKVSWDDLDRDRRLYAYCAQNIHNYKLVLARLNTLY
jgi:hypothetical protein